MEEGAALKKAVLLSDFQKVLPSFEGTQSRLNEWVIQSHLAAEKNLNPSLSEEDLQRISKIAQRYIVKENLISKRRYECSDVFDLNWENHRIYLFDQAHHSGANIQTRNDFYSEKVLEVFNKLYPSENNKPHHLIHVTCTGYVSPSAPQRIKFKEITHAYHMGCYGAFPAIRIADAYAKVWPEKTIDIVHTELCGLHMNSLEHTPEQIIVQSLFADGHIKYSVGLEKEEKNIRGLKVLVIKEEIIPDSEQDMTWEPSSWGMSMTLSRDVPEKIKGYLRNFFLGLCRDLQMSPSELLKTATFAIHPGGPKIIDTAKEFLELSEEQVALSRKVLSQRGNMSSATLPHVWDEILKNPLKSGEKVVSFAFGPGLTIFGGIFEVTGP